MKVWHPKAQNVIESCSVIIFAKGTPANPKCGFTRQIFEIMKEHNIEYAYYDIIADEGMRHWLRHYIKWPTYPMIFVNGKLMGGLDVVKDLVQKGQFVKAFPESCIKGSADERYNKLIGENDTVIFTDGFPFENQITKDLVLRVREKYGGESKIYNVAVDESQKSYITENLKHKLPYVVHKKNVV